MADISKLTLTVKKEDGTTVTTTYDIKDEIAREQLNAIPDGTYPDMSVGNVFSDDSYTEDQTPYLYRVSGGGVEVGKLEADKIVGGTIAWNQLVQNGNFESDTLWVNEPNTTHSIANGILTLTTGIANNGVRQNGFACVTGHKYVLCAESKCDEARRIVIGTSVSFGVSAEKNIGSGWTAISAVVACKASSDNTPIYVFGRNTTLTNAQVRNFCIFDLTQMFGTSVADYIYSLEQSTAGAGVAFFRSLFPKDYYEYNTGELMSVEGLQSHDMVGFNQWDEEWEVGGINVSTGSVESATTRIRSKNFIPVLPNTTYCYRQTASSEIQTTGRVCFYDANKNFISGSSSFPGGSQGFTSPKTFVTPENAAFMKFSPSITYGATYNHDICINISSDRNGEYEPYVKHSYPLDSSLTLRGIPKVADGKMYFDGDTYEADGTVTRKFGVVTLDGTENWTYSGATGRGFYTPINSLVKLTDYSQSIVCDRLTVVSSNYAEAFTSGQYTVSGFVDNNNTYPNQNWLYIKTTDDVTSATALKTWFASNPVTVVYELATPTTESAEPYDSIQKVSKYGTEEYVSTGIVPVGHVTKYPTDIVAKVNGLPSNFSTLIAPTETGFKATRAYSVNQFLIVNNQLYRVTASIANGATITVGTNVTATTIADILTSLLNA